MVKFGKKLGETLYEPWRNHYIDYKRLKKILSGKDVQLYQQQQLSNHEDVEKGAHCCLDSRNTNGYTMNKSDSYIDSNKINQQEITSEPYFSSQTISPFIQASEANSSHCITIASNNQAASPEGLFRHVLEAEIEKIALFFLQEQGRIAETLSTLRCKQQQLQWSVINNEQQQHEQQQQQQLKSFHLKNKNELMKQYRNVGNDIIRFIRFVELNVTGIRKILKKHDKNASSRERRKKSKSSIAAISEQNLLKKEEQGRGRESDYNNNGVNDFKFLSKMYWSLLQKRNNVVQDSHLRQLYHYDGIAALVTTLRLAFTELNYLEKEMLWYSGRNKRQQQQIENEDRYVDVTKNRGANKSSLLSSSVSSPSILTSSFMDSENYTPFSTYYALAQKGCNDACAISDDVIQHHPYPSNNCYNNENTYSNENKRGERIDYSIIYHELINNNLLERIDSARQNLNHSTSFVQIIASQALLFDVSSSSSTEGIGDIDDDDDDADSYDLYRRIVVRHRSATKITSPISGVINLLSTMLYMTNYYIIAPTSGNYACKLGSSSALSGIIIGMTPIAALCSAVLYSWWANHSYKYALLFASACSIIGNVCYAMALSCNNIHLIIIGRLLNGFGGARAINRRFIADSYGKKERTSASAAFVTAGALGMSAGPAIAAILGFFSGDDVEGQLLWTQETSPGWVMFILWSIFFVVTSAFFVEPVHHRSTCTPVKKEEVEVAKETSLLLANGNGTHSTTEEESNGRNAYFSDRRKEREPCFLYSNIPVIITLLIYFVLKMILESLLSSAASITSYYFRWRLTTVGVFLSMLGLLMFPANLVVATLSRRYEDRDIIVVMLMFMIVGVGGILSLDPILPYTALQYVAFGVCVFVSSNALESVNMSLLSKSIPKSMANGTFNSGLLATEAGTFGRAIGDLTITVVGYCGLEYLLNGTFVPLGMIIIATAVITWKFYGDLEPVDDDDDD